MPLLIDGYNPLGAVAIVGQGMGPDSLERAPWPNRSNCKMFPQGPSSSTHTIRRRGYRSCSQVGKGQIRMRVSRNVSEKVPYLGHRQQRATVGIRQSEIAVSSRKPVKPGCA